MIWSALIPKMNAFFRAVEPGRQVGDRVDILRGVAPGERVATTALSRLYDGARVELAAE